MSTVLRGIGVQYLGRRRVADPGSPRATPITVVASVPVGPTSRIVAWAGITDDRMLRPATTTTPLVDKANSGAYI